MTITYSKKFEKYSNYKPQEVHYRARDEKTNRGVHISVKQGWEQPNFRLENGEDGWDSFDEGTVFKNGPQGEMFNYEAPSFYSMFADESMRIPAMKLAMRAVMDHPGIVPSSDLSRHSAPLVRRAVEMGVVPLPRGLHSVEEIGVTNNHRLSDEHAFEDYKYPISDMEMGKATTEIRKALQRDKPRPKPLSTSQFQPQLPIFEQPDPPFIHRPARGGD